LGLRFGSRRGLPTDGGLFLVGLLERDLLLDRLLLARRFLISPLLAGWRVIGGPRRGCPVQRRFSRRDAGGRCTRPGRRLWRSRLL
jgi:hypothetical protein